MEDWKVVWSNETKINHLGSDGRKWAWKEAGEGLSDRLVQRAVKFRGGSVMIWGCMMWKGIEYATRIEGMMDGELYRSILKDELQESIRYSIINCLMITSSSSRTMTPSIPAKRPRIGLKNMI